MINSGQVSDPGPLADGCDPESCTDRVGGAHAPTCDQPRRPQCITHTHQTRTGAEECARRGDVATDARPSTEIIEVWCRNDDRAATTVVHGESYCATCTPFAVVEATESTPWTFPSVGR